MGERRSRGVGGARARLAVAALSTAVVAACSVSTGGPGKEPPSSRDPDVIVVASFDFVESEILAELYAQSLRRYGFPVKVKRAVGPRELLEPSLEEGLVDLVPEYLGTLLSFLAASQGTDTAPTADVNGTFRALVELLEPRGLTALEPAPAQDANGFAVTRETADRHGLQTISDLARVADGSVFGGPPECRDRPLCLPGLERVYGIGFEEFRPLDASGPVTVAALRAGDVDVALLFTTSPYLAGGDLVLLEDDLGLQPAENVVPILRAERLEEMGERFVEAVQAVSRRLLTEELVKLNREVILEGRSPARVAREWLDANGIGG